MAGCRNMFVNVPIILFMLSGIILTMVLEPVHATEDTEETKGAVPRSPLVGKVCPMFCYADVIYSSCGKRWKRGKKVLKSYCNCCLLKLNHPHAKSCKLHLKSGKVIQCS